MLSAFNVNFYPRKYSCHTKCQLSLKVYFPLLPTLTSTGMLNFPCKWHTKKSRYLLFVSNPFKSQKLLHHNPALGFSLIQKHLPRGKDKIICKQRNTVSLILPITTSMADTTAIQPKSSRANRLSQLLLSTIHHNPTAHAQNTPQSLSRLYPKVGFMRAECSLFPCRWSFSLDNQIWIWSLLTYGFEHSCCSPISVLLLPLLFWIPKILLFMQFLISQYSAASCTLSLLFPTVSRELTDNTF